MRILVIGGNGMLGHALLRHWRSRHDVKVTLRRGPDAYEDMGLFSSENAVYGVDVGRMELVVDAIGSFRPEVVVNAVGIIKQRDASADAVASIYTNALFPHLLAGACADQGARVIHLSTDCVFSGSAGSNRESDHPDTESLYGRSKLLGELDYPNAVTLRTSIIGLELSAKASLIEWYLSQREPVNGFSRAIYSGFPTAEMARIIELVALSHPTLRGVYHVASAPISKYDLLRRFSAMLDGLAAAVERDDSFACDRSLDGSRFAAATGYAAPSWDDMLRELANEVLDRSQGAG